MEDSPPAPMIPMPRETDGTHRVPPELLLEVFGFSDIEDLCRFLRVCSSWKAHLLSAPKLWTTMDLTFDISHPSPLPSVLGRSAKLPLSLVCRFSSRWEAAVICEHLKPHMHRVRELALLARGQESYWQIFHEFLHTPAPMMRSLDVSTGTAAPCGSNVDFMRYEQPQQLPPMSQAWTTTCIPEELFGAVPGALREINCGSHYIPEDDCPALSTVTSVRLNISVYNQCALRRAFAVFPRMEELEVRNCCDADALGIVLYDHPLRSASLVSREESDRISWADLVHGRYTQLPNLKLERFHPSVAASLARDPEWTARSLTLGVGARSTATFVAEDRTCGISQSDPHHLLSLGALTQNVCELTISLASGSRPMPNLDLPRLMTLTILCDRALDAETMRQSGRLVAPGLGTVKLATQEADRQTLVDPRLLAEFLSEHVQTDGADLPLLSVDEQHIRISCDPEGLDDLTRVVCYT